MRVLNGLILLCSHVTTWTAVKKAHPIYFFATIKSGRVYTLLTLGRGLNQRTCTCSIHLSTPERSSDALFGGRGTVWCLRTSPWKVWRSWGRRPESTWRLTLPSSPCGEEALVGFVLTFLIIGPSPFILLSHGSYHEYITSLVRKVPSITLCWGQTKQTAFIVLYHWNLLQPPALNIFRVNFHLIVE